MGFNPLNLVKLKDKYHTFKEDHPEMSEFAKALNKHALVEGTVLEIRATNPEGKVLKHEITLTDNDVEFVKTLIGNKKKKEKE